MRKHASPAVLAFPTAGNTRDQHAIADVECRHCAADFFDDADSFVAEGSPGCACSDIPTQDMQVRPADGGFEHADDGIACVAQLGAGSIFPGDVARAMVYKGFHRAPPCIVRNRTARSIPECVFMMAFGVCAAVGAATERGPLSFAI